MKMLTLIHINDNNILIQNGDDISRSQGYAWLKDGEVYFDFEQTNNAVANCRLEPQQINSSYWQQCEQSAIVGNDSGMRHAADLIWRHLSQLKEVHQLDEVVLIVPSHYQTDNLQLLLGVVESCGLKLKGLINKAIYALHQSALDKGNYMHVDVQLHQTVCSEVIVSKGKLKLAQVEILHDVGIQSMQDSLLKAIQNRFIANDRFDPLHHAETEQQLFDQLPVLAQGIAKAGKANVSVDYQLRQHVSSIDIKQWNETLNYYFEKISEVELGSNTDSKVYDFNGFECVGANSNSDFTISSLPPQPSLIGSFISFESDQHENVIYQTEIDISELGKSSSLKAKQGTQTERPVNESEKSISEKLTKPLNTNATHLLQAGVAIPISKAQVSVINNQLSISQSSTSNVTQMMKSKKLFILGSEKRLTLQSDDRLGSNFADGVITVIHVL